MLCIDFPTREELIAYRAGGDIEEIGGLNEKVAAEIGADMVGYNTLEGLARGIGRPLSEICASCHTGNYSCLKKAPQYTQRMRKEKL